MKALKLLTCVSVLNSLLALTAHAQFTPGNLAVLRAGDGTQVLTNTGNSLFIDQYATNGTLTGASVSIPDTGKSALLLSGVAGTEGCLTRSYDKTSLTFIGYNTNRATITTSLGNSTALRAIGVVNPAGVFQLAQTTATVFANNNPRGVATDNGTQNFWAAGGSDGTVYFAPPSSSTVIQSKIGNTRYIKIVNGNLFFSTQSGTEGIYTLSSSASSLVPVGLTQTAAFTNMLFATGSKSAPVAFEMNPAMTIAYVADQRTTAGGGIQKWTNNGTAWVFVYTLSVGANMGAFGLAADFSGTTPVLYATTVEPTSSNRLVRIVDTASTAASTVLAMSGYNRIFRGVDFTPDARPTIATQPKSQIVSAGADVLFSVSATSPYPLSYQWRKDGANIDSATSATLTLRTVTSADQGSYSVVVSNQFASVTSSAVSLQVNAAAGFPTINGQPQNATNIVGETATFNVTAGGSIPLSYQWLVNSNIISGATNASLVLSNLTANDQGYYSVQVSNSVGQTNSQSAFLKVISLPPTITIQPVSQTVRAYSTVILSVAATGTGPFTYRWSFEGSPLNEQAYSGAASDTLTIPVIQFFNAGNYTVSITGPGGSTNSQPATVRVVPVPSYVLYKPGTVYSQDFDSLPNPGTNTVNSANPVTINSITYSLDNAFDFGFPVQSTDAGGLGLSNTMAGWYGWASASAKFGASAGDQTTGGIISFGSTNSASTNRSLGLLATSSSGTTAFGVKIINATSQTLTQMNVGFTGQLWRQQPTAKSIVFGYYVDPTGTNEFPTNMTGYLTNLTISFPTNATANGGTEPLASKTVSATNQPIEWSSSATLWLVWQMTNSAGSAQGLGIDNLTFSASGAPAPVYYSISVRLSDAGVVLSWPTAATGYQLQYNSDLRNGIGWTYSQQSVTSQNGTNTVVVPADQKARFYRLIQ